MSKEGNYQWQGVPIKVEFGYSTVTPVKDKPLYWYNYDCEVSPGTLAIALIPAIKITTYDEQFVISNQWGVGIEKVRNGGWPNMPHSSLPINSFEQHEGYKITHFNLEEIKRLNKKRDDWMKENHPKEFRKMQALKQLIS